MMRITANLPDDVYELASAIASARGISLGDAIADLVRRGLRPFSPKQKKNAFPTFAVRLGGRPITREQTMAAEDEL